MFATAIRFIGKKPKPKMKPIELKTPPEQTQTITRAIFDILKEHGPLTIADTWEHVKVLFFNFYIFANVIKLHMWQWHCVYLDCIIFAQWKKLGLIMLQHEA